MKLWVNSLIFHIVFYGWTGLCAVAFVPLLLFPRPYALKAIRGWARGVFWSAAHILGLRFRITGREKIPATPLIFAVKHQSAWETIIFHQLCFDVAIVLKQDLLWIPFFGWYLKKVATIPVSRSKRRGAESLRKLLKAAQVAVQDEGRHILIFPEGTRSKPGQQGIYHTGVASLYLHLNIPVVPVALNSGVYWPRRGFLRYPGVITLAFLDPIYPGLTRKEFMQKLQHEIESTSHTLLKGAPTHDEKP